MAVLNTSKEYSPGELGQYVGGAGEAWNGKEFFVGGEKYRIEDAGNGNRRVRQMNPTRQDIESGRAMGDLTPFLVNEISNQIIELENKLASIPGVSLSPEEMDAFLEKAITQVEPYYNQKKSEIEQGIKEGKIRTAEDTLILIRQVTDDVRTNLAKYDIDQAESEEDFINRMAEITSIQGENLETKQFEWRNRLDTAKQDLVKSQTYSSGIGIKQVNELEARKQQEIDAVNRAAETAKTETETAKKFSLERITLARQAVTDERKRRIGDESQTAALEAQSRAELGLSADDPLASESDIYNSRAQRNTTVQSPEALTDLEEERRRAVESRKLSLQEEELDIRKTEEEKQRQAIQSQIAAKQRQMQSYT